jgi:hypothetical protein
LQDPGASLSMTLSRPGPAAALVDRRIGSVLRRARPHRARSMKESAPRFAQIRKDVWQRPGDQRRPNPNRKARTPRSIAKKMPVGSRMISKRIPLFRGGARPALGRHCSARTRHGGSP